MMSSSTMHVNPDIPEAHALRGWYDAAGAEQQFQSHTSSMPSGGGITFDRAEIRNLNDVKVAELGMFDKPDNFCARATIMHIKNDNISYPACPTPGCGKKVVQMGDSWRCEKCDKSFPKPEHRYVYSRSQIRPRRITCRRLLESSPTQVYGLDGGLGLLRPSVVPGFQRCWPNCVRDDR